MQQSPYGHTGLLLALEETLNPVTTIIIRGDELLKDWQEAVGKDYQPRQMVFAIPDACTGLPGLLNERKPAPGGIAYHCKGTRCQPPITDKEHLKSLVMDGQ
jgi:uncharacterized protein YyaL (SSP411 family)